LLVAMLGAALGAAIGSGSVASSSMTVHAFKIGLGCAESGGNYWARNASSGSYGKYQIMPANWPGWAQTYLGNRNAPQTPRNQERVTRGKVLGLYDWLDTWRNTAHWWLTGSSNTNEDEWSSDSTNYVNKVMGFARKALTEAGRQSLPDRCLSTPSNPNP
jgi:hypothetical protein